MNRDKKYFTKLKQWQDDFFKQPVIYYVMITSKKHKWELSDNFYDSEESAQIEVEWLKKYLNFEAIVVKEHIHNLELSQRRWNGNFIDAEEFKQYYEENK